MVVVVESVIVEVVVNVVLDSVVGVSADAVVETSVVDSTSEELLNVEVDSALGTLDEDGVVNKSIVLVVGLSGPLDVDESEEDCSVVVDMMVEDSASEEKDDPVEDVESVEEVS